MDGNLSLFMRLIMEGTTRALVAESLPSSLSGRSLPPVSFDKRGAKQ